MIEAAIRRVRLGRRDVLHDVALSIEPGRWVAIVGPNGAGKSTLLRTLAGLLPFEGAIGLDGRALADWSARERARRVAWLGQGEGGGDELLAREVVMLGRAPHQAWLAPPAARDYEAVREAMLQTQCWDWRERRLGSLSGGERQRVLLARALAVQAPVVLMDEPLAHLDAPHQSDWLQTVRGLRDRGDAVVSVLHELSIALLADELVVMAAGRIVHRGAPADDATHRALQRVFEHRLRLLRVDGQWLAVPS